MADARVQEEAARKGPRSGKLISFNLAGDQRPPTGFTAPEDPRFSYIDFRAFQHPTAACSNQTEKQTENRESLSLPPASSFGKTR